MVSSYTESLRLEKQGHFENYDTWDLRLNNVIDLLDDAIAGDTRIVTTGGDTVLSIANADEDEARPPVLLVNGTLAADANIIIPNLKKGYTVFNRTSGEFKVFIKTTASNIIEIEQNGTSFIHCDGADLIYADARPRGSAIPFVIDGGGLVIGTGIRGDLQIPFGCTINSWTLLADQVGSIVVDIWKDTYDNFPPDVADSICAASLPTLSSASKATSTSLPGWTTTINPGDILRYSVQSVSSIKRVTVSLKVFRSTGE